MSTGMGDGDLVDPEVHSLDDAETAAPSPDEAVAPPVGDDEVPERASEIDDITEPIPRPGDEVDAVALVAERDEYKAIAQRIQADFDNFRRQAAQRTQDEADRATGRLAQALLPMLDAAESAYLAHPDEVGPLLNTMLTELKKHGLETLDLDGAPFDPEVAEAVAHEPGDGAESGEPVVTEVLRSGYRWKGRTLRPAMVRTRG